MIEYTYFYSSKIFFGKNEVSIKTDFIRKHFQFNCEKRLQETFDNLYTF
jgi:hypothetical protein